MSLGSPPSDVLFPVIPPSPAGLPPFHQVAIFCTGGIAHVNACVSKYEALGYDEWIIDQPLYMGTLNGEPIRCRGYLRFNYQVLGGVELEFLWHEGDSPWLRRAAPDAEEHPYAFISHMSAYVNDVEETATKLHDTLGDPYYIRETHDHMNEHVKGKKRFREFIYNTHWFMGFDVKTIQRIPWGDG